MALRAEYECRWYITRLECRHVVRSPAARPCHGFAAAREPGRGYHIVQADAGALAASMAKYEKDGYLVR